MLTLDKINVYYGHVHALRDVSIKVKAGSIVSLLGSNGAGKSTTLKTISRLTKVKDGDYKLNDQSMIKKNPTEIVKAGIIHCPEGRKVFSELTVMENLKAGAYLRKDKEKIGQDIEKIFDYFPRLKERINQKAGTLSGGEQQMLAIGRALMSAPKILLLDEPSLGIAPILVREIFEIIRQVNAEGMTVLLVEQNANMALDISEYSYVLENGRVALEGLSENLKESEDIRRLYLGG